MKLKNKPSLKIFLLCGLLLPVIARADTFTVTNTIADAFLAASNPTLNYGGAGTLAIAPAGSPKGEFDSVIKFNLTNAFKQFNSTYGVGGWQITGLTLKLASNFGSDGAIPNNTLFNTITNGLFDITWLADDGWNEGNGGGSGTPGFPGNSAVSFDSIANLFALGSSSLGTYTYNPPGNNTYASYSLTLDPNLVADTMAGNDVSLYFSAADDQVSYLFNARSMSFNPQLVVSAIPEPTVMSLAAVAVGGFFLRRKKS